MESKLLSQIRESFNLEPLPLLVQRLGVFGAARLSIRQCFAPERVVTLAFSPSLVNIAIVGTREWHGKYYSPKRGRSEGGSGNIVFDLNQIVRESASIGYCDTPESMAGWEAFIAWAWPLESCDHSTYDGTLFVHEVIRDGVAKVVSWLNPQWNRDTNQMYVLQSYLHIIKRAKLDWLVAEG